MLQMERQQGTLSGSCSLLEPAVTKISFQTLVMFSSAVLDFSRRPFVHTVQSDHQKVRPQEGYYPPSHDFVLRTHF